MHLKVDPAKNAHSRTAANRAPDDPLGMWLRGETTNMDHRKQWSCPSAAIPARTLYWNPAQIQYKQEAVPWHPWGVTTTIRYWWEKFGSRLASPRRWQLQLATAQNSQWILNNADVPSSSTHRIHAHPILTEGPAGPVALRCTSGVSGAAPVNLKPLV